MNEVLSYIPTKKLVVAYNLISCIYMSILVILLITLDYIYQIGKYNMYMLPMALILSEIIKYNVMKFLNQSEIKMMKTKKIMKKFKLKEWFSSITITLIMVFIFYTISILFGAPLLSDKEETLMFSILLTVLTVIPACLHLGSYVTMDILSNLTTFKGDQFCKMILHNIQATLIGAWLGAIVIPLDWDRPWQIWPIPCSSGALIGYTFANVINLLFEIK